MIDYRTLPQAIESSKVLLSKFSGAQVSLRDTVHYGSVVIDYGSQFLPGVDEPPPRPVMMTTGDELEFVKGQLESLVACEGQEEGHQAMHASKIPWALLVSILKFLISTFADTPTP